MKNNLSEANEIKRLKEEYRRRSREIPEQYYGNKKNKFIYRRREEEVRRLFRTHQIFPLKGKRMLEIGCGQGAWLQKFEEWGADAAFLAGLDFDENKIEIARKKIPKADLICQEASHFPWEDNHFDLVLQATLFTSILEESLKQKIAKEMVRVLKPGGYILWYDFHYNNPWNPHVRGIKRGEIAQLFPRMDIQLEQVTLAPPLSRLFAPRLEFFCKFLEAIPFLRSHYLGFIKK